MSCACPHPPAIAGLDHQPATMLVFGPDCIERIGDKARILGASRVLLVSDDGVASAGHVSRVEHFLGEAGVAVATFAGTHENPTTDDVNAALAVAQDAKPDLIVGLGGGSSLDTAKGCNILLTNGGRVADYWGVGKVAKPMLPFIAVPTTHGTGSETQSFALIADASTHHKMACGDPKVLPKVAFLDPLLTLTQPRRVAACTGIDAITHAVESFVCTKRNDVSIAYARESYRLTVEHFARSLEGNDLDARGAMLLGAAYAGLAIENSMLGAAHSAANPLTAHFDVTHGHAVGLMLPHVVRYNAELPEVRAMYEQLAPLDELIATLRGLLDAAQLPTKLSDLGVTEDAIDTLAAEAAGQWTANFNPRPIAAGDFADLYMDALHGRGI